jgi:hypothetical protein
VLHAELKVTSDAPIHGYTLELFNTAVELGIHCYTPVERPTMINMQHGKSLALKRLDFLYNNSKLRKLPQAC